MATLIAFCSKLKYGHTLLAQRHITSHNILPIVFRKFSDISPSTTKETIGLSAESDTSLLEFKGEWSPGNKAKFSNDMRVLVDFITEDEESKILEEIEPYMKRMRYEFDHWDDAIHGFRETERKHWYPHNREVLERVRRIGFQEEIMPYIHILDLAEEGVIKPHIDSTRYCGHTIAGISLLSDAVMRLVFAIDKEDNSHTADYRNQPKAILENNFYAEILLPRRSLYIMRFGFMVHCNNCYRRYKDDPNVGYHLYVCAHVVCSRCKGEICPVCLKPSRTMAVNEDLPRNVADYFYSMPLSIYRHFQKVTKFQYEQEQIIMEYMYTNNEQRSKGAKAEKAKYTKIYHHLQNKLKKEDELIEKYKRYIAKGEAILKARQIAVKSNEQKDQSMGRHELQSQTNRPRHSNEQPFENPVTRGVIASRSSIPQYKSSVLATAHRPLDLSMSSKSDQELDNRSLPYIHRKRKSNTDIHPTKSASMPRMTILGKRKSNTLDVQQIKSVSMPTIPRPHSTSVDETSETTSMPVRKSKFPTTAKYENINLPSNKSAAYKRNVRPVSPVLMLPKSCVYGESKLTSAAQSKSELKTKSSNNLKHQGSNTNYDSIKKIEKKMKSISLSPIGKEGNPLFDVVVTEPSTSTRKPRLEVVSEPSKSTRKPRLEVVSEPSTSTRKPRLEVVSEPSTSIRKPGFDVLATKPSTSTRKPRLEVVSEPSTSTRKPRLEVVTEPSTSIRKPGLDILATKPSKSTRKPRLEVVSEPSTSTRKPGFDVLATKPSTSTRKPRLEVVSEPSTSTRKPRHEVVSEPSTSTRKPRLEVLSEPSTSTRKPRLEVVSKPSTSTRTTAYNLGKKDSKDQMEALKLVNQLIADKARQSIASKTLPQTKPKSSTKRQITVEDFDSPERAAELLKILENETGSSSPSPPLFKFPKYSGSISPLHNSSMNQTNPYSNFNLTKFLNMSNSSNDANKEKRAARTLAQGFLAKK